MLPIETEQGVKIINRAYSFKFRKPEERIAPLTLDQAKTLVK